MMNNEIKDKMTKFNVLLGRANFSAKDYQCEGIEWCLRKELAQDKKEDVKGGIVADEMGLGKTMTLIGLMFVNFKRRTLIVVPPVLLDQWAKEIFKCSGHKALKYHGPDKKNITEEELLKAPIVLTTYNMLLSSNKRSDKRPDKRPENNNNLLAKIKWNRLIFDEAHHLRNKRTERYSSCEKIKAEIKWLISGTPIQNKRSDLYNLFKIIGIKDAKQDNIKDLAEKYILRRTKAEVGINLPPVIKEERQVQWTNKHEQQMSEELHSLLPNQTHVFLKNNNSNSELADIFEGKGILTAIMKARQSCIMPALLIPNIREPINNGEFEEPQNYVRAIKSSSKLDAVINLILERKDNGNGKIIFCHFRNEIDAIAERLTKGGLKKVVTYDGRNSRTPGINLADAADAIVLQIQTGCEGLNLQANFSEIYFVSPHWNPCVEDQAVARCHRIGQTKPTYVFKFAMSNFTKQCESESDKQSDKQQQDKQYNEDEEDDDEDNEEEQKQEQSLESYVNKVQTIKRSIISEVIRQ
jgi:SNF2 family DNA or RNA helicase